MVKTLIINGSNIHDIPSFNKEINMEEFYSIPAGNTCAANQVVYNLRGISVNYVIAGCSFISTGSATVDLLNKQN